MSAIIRRHLRDEIRTIVIDRILSGGLPEGEVVGEEALAVDIGVSRTPLREALLTLQRDGFVESHHGRGFIVRPLTVLEAQELYPIVWTLEGFALSHSAPATPAQLKQLGKLNRDLRSGQSTIARTAADAEWHRLLLDGCRNAKLTEVLSSLKLATQRYELSYLAADPHVATSVREHAEILRLLSNGRASEARKALTVHWQRGMRRLIAALATRPRP
jgi:DNA-binding GntR family transcriptional regulator